jgi:hypothetical protein
MSCKTTAIYFALSACLAASYACGLGSGGGSDTAGRAQAFTPPQAGPADSEGWETYSEPLTLTKDTVAGLYPGHGSPEAAVVHFYASRIRGDSRYKEVLPPDWEQSSSLKRKLERMSKWTFEKVTLLKRKKRRSERYWIMIEMTISYEGKTDSGSDEAEVRQIEGRWYITRPPT